MQKFRRVARGAHDLALLDGWHLLRDAVRAGLAIETVAIVGDAQEHDSRRLISQLENRPGTHVVRVSASVMNALSPVKTPSGVVALAHRPAVALASALKPLPPLVLIAVDVQDPGNVGALVRSAEAGGATGVVVAGHGADPWGWKALRAAMGSTFRMPVLIARDVGQLCDELHSHGVSLIATLPRGGIAMHEQDWRKPVALLLGGEGAGLPEEIVSKIDDRLSIPMHGEVESLNVAVAAALLVYEAQRQRRV